MRFTYQAYRELLELLRRHGYAFTDYHHYNQNPRCVILRHDIDSSLPQAVKLAETEAEMGVRSTWFVLLRTDFYNVASQNSQKLLRTISSMGHEIGLHFDEKAYGQELSAEETIAAIQKERGVLEALFDAPVTTVSMHRPSKATLEADLQIPGMMNSYGKTFFHDFKYLSDSRRRWREPVLDIVRSEEYDRLHILTHAFWYHNVETSLEQAVSEFTRAANRERYQQQAENITDLASILREEDV